MMSILLYIVTTIRSVFLLTPIRMTLNDLKCSFYNSSLSGRHAWRTYVVAFRADNAWLSATKRCPMNCSFWAKEICMNFRGGLLHRRWQTGVELWKNGNTTEFRIYREMCGLLYYYYKRLSNDTKTDDLERYMWVHNVRKLHRTPMLDAFDLTIT